MSTTYDAGRIDAKSYDTWLDQQVTAADEYDDYWERFFEQAEESFEDGKYNTEFVDFLEHHKYKGVVPYIVLREDFIEKKAKELEAAFSKQEADIRTEMAVNNQGWD
jgi:hypothetical protein